MVNSVEIRMPFMDHRVVSHVHSFPYSSKFGGRYIKKLIRDAMDPYMPKDITWRKSKIGSNTPIVDWMQGNVWDWFGDTVHEERFIVSDLADNPLQLQSVIMDIINKKCNNYFRDEKCWTELSPYIWGKAVLNKN